MSDYAPPSNSQTTLGQCKERLRQAKSERQQYEPDWYMNLAYFQGRQWVYWDGRGIFEPKIERIKVTVNQVQAIIRTEVAKVTKERPGWMATPRTGDEQASNDALTGSRLIDWGYDALNFGQARRDAIQWSRLCGAGFVKATWDPMAGDGGCDVLVNEVSGEAITHPSTGRVLKPGDMPEIEQVDGIAVRTIGEGEIVLTVRSPFDIFPDPLARNLDECRWIIDESVRAPEYITDRFPDAQPVKPDAPSQTGIVESRTLANTSTSTGGELLGVRVWEMWEKPSPSCPDGRHVVWCDGQILADEPNPYGCIPYFMFTGLHVPGRFWPDAVTTHLRSPQDRLNKLLSQIAENAARFGNPSLMIDALADVKYYGVPGEQITFNGTTQTAVPQFLTPPSMPPYVFQVMDQFTQALRDISGQYEVSNGTVPAGVTAASAISLLQEQDSTRLAPDIEAMEDTIGDIGQFVLELMAEHYTTERIIVIAGEDGVIDVDAFRSSAAFKVPDVKVRPYSTFPRSIAARQAAIRDTLNMLLQYGVPLTGSAIARALRDMQVGGVEDLVDSFSADQAQISREHADFLRDLPLIGNELVDNHPVHIATHKDFAKSGRFKGLPPDQQQKMFEHIKWHMQFAPATLPTLNPPQPMPGPETVPTQASGNPLPDLSAPPPAA